jgi:nitroreductase
MYADFVNSWKENRVDILFRGAPHLLIASAPTNCPTPEVDCVIALSYFELFAQSYGIGTVWDGLATSAFVDLVPQMRQRLGIPEDHQIGYVMAFGKPAVQYVRTVQHHTALIAKVQG